MYIHLQNKMCKELEALEEKYRTGAEMSEGDLRRIDLLTHSLKSLAAYIEKKEQEEYRGMEHNSYMNNSYMNNSYAPYRNNMSRFTGREDMSGHYPYYPEERRW